MEQDAVEIRLSKLERDVDILNSKICTSAVEQATINEKISGMIVTLSEVKQSVLSLQQVPMKHWETLIGSLITGFVSALAGFLIGKFLL